MILKKIAEFAFKNQNYSKQIVKSKNENKLKVLVNRKRDLTKFIAALKQQNGNNLYVNYFN